MKQIIMNRNILMYHDSLRVSASGFIHLRILSERLEYLYGILPATPILDQEVAGRIANTISIENRNGAVGGYQMLNCVKLFCKYLQSEVSRIRENFSQFGLADSGAVYIVRQLQSAIDHFERPVRGGLGAANPLDA